MNEHLTENTFTGEQSETQQRGKKGPPPPPIIPPRVNVTGSITGRKNVDKHVIWHFGNTGKFHPLSEIRATIDPTLSAHSYRSVIGNMKKRANKWRIDMRPGAKGDDRFRFSTRIEKHHKVISLTEIEEKFDPLIEDFLKQASLPISHQSSDRFRMAATTLKKLLKEWGE